MSSREVKTPYYDFFRIEKEMNLFSLKYKEVYYWQLLRMGVLKKITVKDLHIISADKNRNFKNEIIKTFKEAKRMKKIYLEMPKADIVQIRPCVTVTKDNQLDDHQFDYISLKDRYAVLDLYYGHRPFADSSCSADQEGRPTSLAVPCCSSSGTWCW